MIFSEKLITLRKRYGLSQDDLAQKLNVTRQAVYKWENAQSIPDIENLKILSKIFNVSVDNLLDDDSELTYKTPTEKKTQIAKKSYGRVIDIGRPYSESAETDNTILLPSEKEKLRTRKRVLKACRYTMLNFPVMFVVGLVLFIIDEKLTESLTFSMFWVLSIWLTIAAIVAYFICRKRLYPTVETSRAYFFNKKSEQESILLKKGYDFVALQPDLLQWFFYDPKKATFGFYFDKEEQFICPIQNYVGFSYRNNGERDLEVGSRILPGVIVGAFTGVSIGREQVTMKSRPMFFEFKLNYCNEQGELRSYVFYLSSFREYARKHFKYNREAQLGYFNGISQLTENAYLTIKDRLDFESSKLQG